MQKRLSDFYLIVAFFVGKGESDYQINVVF